MKIIKKTAIFTSIMFFVFLITSCQWAKKTAHNLHSDSDFSTALGAYNLEAVKESVAEGADVNKCILMGVSNPLLEALQSSHDSIAEYLLDAGANPNYIDGDGISLLMYAAGAIKLGYNNDNIVSINNCELLLKHGANVNEIGKNGYSALDYAAHDNGTEENVKVLLNHGAKIRSITLKAALEGYNQSNNQGYADEGVVREILLGLRKEGISSGLDPALEAAILGDSIKEDQLIKENKLEKNDETQVVAFTAAFGSTDTMQLLLDKGISVNTYSPTGNSLITTACQYGNLDMVKYLFNKGANIVNNKNKDSETAFSIAIRYNNLNIAEFLFQHGAKFQVDDDPPLDPDDLCIAAGSGNVEMVKWIITNGYPLNDQNTFEAMKETAENNQLNVLQYFLDRGVSPDIKDDNGETILSYITDHSSIDTVKFLVGHGANVNGGTSSSRTYGEPLSTAAWFERLDIAEYLIDHGADVNAGTNEIAAVPALSEAIIYGNFDIVKLLVEHDANLNYKDNTNNGETPLQIAEEYPSKHIINYLKQHSSK